MIALLGHDAQDEAVDELVRLELKKLLEASGDLVVTRAFDQESLVYELDGWDYCVLTAEIDSQAAFMGRGALLDHKWSLRLWVEGGPYSFRGRYEENNPGHEYGLKRIGGGLTAGTFDHVPALRRLFDTFRGQVSRDAQGARRDGPLTLEERHATSLLVEVLGELLAERDLLEAQLERVLQERDSAYARVEELVAAMRLLEAARAESAPRQQRRLVKAAATVVLGVVVPLGVADMARVGATRSSRTQACASERVGLLEATDASQPLRDRVATAVKLARQLDSSC